MKAQTGRVRSSGRKDTLRIQGLPTIWNSSSNTKSKPSAGAKVAKARSATAHGPPRPSRRTPDQFVRRAPSPPGPGTGEASGAPEAAEDGVGDARAGEAVLVLQDLPGGRGAELLDAQEQRVGPGDRLPPLQDRGLDDDVEAASGNHGAPVLLRLAPELLRAGHRHDTAADTLRRQDGLRLDRRGDLGAAGD